MSNYDWPKIMANKEDQELKYIYASRKYEPIVKVQAAIKELHKRGYSDVEFNFASIKSQKEIDENTFVIHNKSKILRFASSFFKVLYVITIISSVFYALFFIIELFLPGSYDSMIPTNLPIKINNFPIKLGNNDSILLSVYNISASVRIGKQLWMLSILNKFIIFIASLLTIYILKVIRSLITGVKSNNSFSPEMFSKLKNVALIYLFSGILFWGYSLFSQYYLISHIDLSGIVNDNFQTSVNYNIGELIKAIVFPLVIIIVTEIFRQGAKLKEEQESFI